MAEGLSECDHAIGFGRVATVRLAGMLAVLLAATGIRLSPEYGHSMGQIQTSVQACGMTSERRRGSAAAVADRLALGTDVTETRWPGPTRRMPGSAS